MPSSLHDSALEPLSNAASVETDATANDATAIASSTPHASSLGAPHNSERRAALLSAATFLSETMNEDDEENNKTPEMVAFQTSASQNTVSQNAASPDEVSPTQNRDNGAPFAEIAPVQNPATSRSSVARGENELSRNVAPRFSPALMSSVPALLLLSLGLVTRHLVLPPALSNEAGIALTDSALQTPLSAQNAIVSESQTMIVQPRATANLVVWHAQLQETRGVTGHAPIDGQITRVWVKEGQRVEVGDRILRIASSAPVMPAADAPRVSNRRAENAQIEASRAQNSLQLQMERAQTQLAAAQQRVARAKTRIAQATEIVRKLQAGIASGETSSNIEHSNYAQNPTPDNSNADTENAQHAATVARNEALADAQNVQRQAERAQKKAASAQSAADEAESNAKSLTQKARKLRAEREREVRDADSVKALNAADATDDEPLARLGDNAAKAKPKPRAVPAVTTAQFSIDEAESRAQDAAKTASRERERARKMADEAMSANAAAQTAQERATRLLRQLKVFGDDSSVPKRNSESRSATRVAKTSASEKLSRLPSISDAARMVRAATDESADAQREARRLQSQVENYAQQAKETGETFASSSSELGSEERSALDRTLQANLSIMRAPASGTVSWVAGVTDSVKQGDAILRMGQNGALRACFVDYSGLWRNLKTDVALSALASDSAQRPISLTSSTRLAAKTASQTDVLPTRDDAVPATARIESVAPPKSAGEPAVVRMVVAPSLDNGRRSRKARRLRAGMTLWCSLDSAGGSNALSVPRSVLLTTSVTPNATGPNANASSATESSATTPNANASHFATNGETQSIDRNGRDSAPGNALQNAPSSAGNAAKNSVLIAVLTPLDATNGDEHRIEWRRVELGASQGDAEQIVSGLAPGERVALYPATLWAYAQTYGAAATVRLNRAS